MDRHFQNIQTAFSREKKGYGVHVQQFNMKIELKRCHQSQE